MEKDQRFIETIGRNIKYCLDNWTRRRDYDVMAMLNDNIGLAIEAGASLSVKVKPRAFRKENILTYFPDGMKPFGKREEDGSMTFEISSDLRLHAVEIGEPYILLNADSCSLEAHFSPSDVESINLH